MVPLGVDAQVEARFGPFGESVNLDQDRCTVYVEHIIGSEIILEVPDGTPRWRGSCGTSLVSLRRQC